MLIAFTGHIASPLPAVTQAIKVKLTYNLWEGCCKGPVCQKASSPRGFEPSQVPLAWCGVPGPVESGHCCTQGKLAEKPAPTTD